MNFSLIKLYLFSDQSGSDQNSLGYQSMRGRRESASNSTLSSYMSSYRSSDTSPIRRTRSGASPCRSIASRGSSSAYEYDVESNFSNMSLPGLETPPSGYDPGYVYEPSTGVGRSGKLYGAKKETEQQLKAVTTKLGRARLNSAGSKDGDDTEESDGKRKALATKKVKDWDAPLPPKSRSMRSRRSSDPAPRRFGEIEQTRPHISITNLQRGNSLPDVPLDNTSQTNLSKMRSLHCSDALMSSKSSLNTDYSLANDTDLSFYEDDQEVLNDDEMIIPDDMREFLKERQRLSRQEDRKDDPKIRRHRSASGTREKRTKSLGRRASSASGIRTSCSPMSQQLSPCAVQQSSPCSVQQQSSCSTVQQSSTCAQPSPPCSLSASQPVQQKTSNSPSGSQCMFSDGHQEQTSGYTPNRGSNATNISNNKQSIQSNQGSAIVNNSRSRNHQSNAPLCHSTPAASPNPPPYPMYPPQQYGPPPYGAQHNPYGTNGYYDSHYPQYNQYQQAFGAAYGGSWSNYPYGMMPPPQCYPPNMGSDMHHIGGQQYGASNVTQNGPYGEQQVQVPHITQSQLPYR